MKGFGHATIAVRCLLPLLVAIAAVFPAGCERVGPKIIGCQAAHRYGEEMSVAFLVMDDATIQEFRRIDDRKVRVERIAERVEASVERLRMIGKQVAQDSSVQPEIQRGLVEMVALMAEINAMEAVEYREHLRTGTKPPPDPRWESMIGQLNTLTLEHQTRWDRICGGRLPETHDARKIDR